MASGAVVDVDFGVGTLRCEDLAPSFDFTQRLDPTPRSSTASGSVSSGLPKRRRLPSDGKAFASSTKGGGRVGRVPDGLRLIYLRDGGEPLPPSPHLSGQDTKRLSNG